MVNGVIDLIRSLSDYEKEAEESINGSPLDDVETPELVNIYKNRKKNKSLKDMIGDFTFEDQYTKKDVNQLLYDWRVRTTRIVARLQGVDPNKTDIDPLDTLSETEYETVYHPI